ncbi:MAG: exodeoxyribonuclease V subunit alpha [Sphingobacteriales bacterium]|nr:MAG: exodeoxyribonuclease V subunit alpha [Sphingobacteriales bacterium]
MTSARFLISIIYANLAVTRGVQYMNSGLNVHGTFAQYFSKDALNPWLYQLSKAMEAGNVCLDVNQTFTEEENEIKPDPASLPGHPLVGDEHMQRPFILHKDKLYLHRFFQYEKKLVAKIKDLIAAEQVEERKQQLSRQQQLISKALFPTTDQLQTTDWQKVACINAFLNAFSIISGGPGTGKTTTVTKLLALLLAENPALHISICAPTGKAAARLEESISQAENSFSHMAIDPAIVQKITQLNAQTIHSLLGYIHNSIHFRHNQDNTLDTDVLIVDECSMIDIALFYKLFQAIDTSRTKVILLGDKNQLASVDAGSVFRDLCSDTVALNTFSAERAAFINQFIAHKAQQVTDAAIEEQVTHPLFQHIIELQTSYRFSDEAGIGKLSKAVLNNDTGAISTFLNNQDPIITILPPEALQDNLRRTASLLHAVNGGYIGLSDPQLILSKINNSTVLCAIKEGKYGVYSINNFISQELFKPSSVNYPYQLIMVTQNQARDGVYNGDMGIVLADREELKVYFSKAGTDYISLNPAQIMATETAFAMTIHKSQGSEFNEVLIVLPDNKKNQLLSRELLYTAITRAREKVTIIGTPEVIFEIAAKSVKRVSGIAHHF